MFENDRDKNDIERLLQDEIREQRKAGSGARHNSGNRGGGKGKIRQGIRMPSDVLKANDKKAYKKYIGSGEILVSNIYSDVTKLPTFEELQNMDLEKAHAIAKVAKDLHSNKELCDYWGLSSGGIYKKVFEAFGVDYPHQNNPKKGIVDEYADINKIPQIKGLEKMNLDVVQNIFTSSRSQHSTNELVKYWTTNAYAYYNMLDKYKVPYMHRGKRKKTTRPAAEKNHSENASLKAKIEKLESAITSEHEEEVEKIEKMKLPDVVETVAAPVAAPVVKDVDLFQLKYLKSDVLGEELQKRILDYMSIVYSDKKYQVSLLIKELL